MTKGEVRQGLQIALAREGHRTAGLSLLRLAELVLSHGLSEASLNGGTLPPVEPGAGTREGNRASTTPT
jgi:hypothetical protein